MTSEPKWVMGVKPEGLTEVEDMLWESNAIEDEWSDVSFTDAKLAWDFLAKKKKLHPRDIKEMHGILMGRLWPEIAGMWRWQDIQIGGQVKHYRSAAHFDHQILNLLTMMRTQVPDLTTEKEEFAKKMHVLYEDYHPFRDGNGRTGRILYNWHRLQMGLPIHVIHHGEEQMKYYGWFKDPNYKYGKAIELY